MQYRTCEHDKLDILTRLHGEAAPAVPMAAARRLHPKSRTPNWQTLSNFHILITDESLYRRASWRGSTGSA